MALNHALPRGWEIKKMPEVVTWGSGGTPTATEKAYYENGTIPWLIIGDLTDGLVTSATTKITKEGLQNSSAKMIPPGTLLVAMYGSIGKLGITGIECCTNQAIAFAKELCGVTTKYMFYYMSMMKSRLISMGRGGTQKNISQSILKSLDVIVPPLPEQERIVTRIEELFSELDKAVETIQTIKQQLAVYRQAVLKAFFETEPPSGELGDVLILLQNGIAKRKSSQGTDTIVLRLADISNDTIVESDDMRTILLTNEERDLYLLQPKDILFVRVNGSPNRVGRMLIVSNSKEYAFCDHLIRGRLDLNCVEPQYIKYAMGGSKARKYINQNMVSTAGQNTISQMAIRKVPLYLPDIETQRAIIKEVDSRLSVCDNIEEAVDAALTQAAALRQSILKEAFEGRLSYA